MDASAVVQVGRARMSAFGVSWFVWLMICVRRRAQPMMQRPTAFLTAEAPISLVAYGLERGLLGDIVSHSTCFGESCSSLERRTLGDHPDELL